MPRPLFRYSVVPSLPDVLKPLFGLAFNLHWEWDPEAIDLFRRLDPDLWEASGHNPVLMLGHIDQQRLRLLARDDGFRAQMERVTDRLDRYMRHQPEWPGATPDVAGPQIAYLSAEFGLTECLQIYSGGLGILAGDHMKAASDVGLPLVGVGLLYQEGYFRQYLNPDGWQQERYPQNDFHNLPVQPVTSDDGDQLTITIDFPGRPVLVRLWKVQVGRVPLYLLDTNDPQNREADRAITNQLYGGDNEKRIEQEMVLGIGGVRALDRLGFHPSVYHMNEGHSAFLALERIRNLMAERHLSFEEAKVLAASGNVFTTHTPVSAGSDYFPSDLVDRYLSNYYTAFGISREQFLGLGRQRPQDQNESFCTTILALRLASFRFGVSRLHGQIARNIWHGCWPDVPEDEVPIGHVTNGVHIATWASIDMASLLERYLGPRWHEAPGDKSLWEGVGSIPDEELWRTHERRRERLVAFTRRRLREQRLAVGAPAADVALASEVLSPDALTIGFARRFATYKRATLLFRDPERLARLLNDRDRPVQIIIAGKAHPADDPGKDLIRQIVHFTRRPELAHNVVFLEDYDLVVARYLVQGVDVWLNTPRRPLEASGTSGMKAALNGALNMSILDGWWDEAYSPEVGWAIGHGEEYADLEQQDRIEADALYHLLEVDVRPLFYQRGNDRLPRAWIAKVKAAIRAICPEFNTQRMVQEYATRGYQPAANRYQTLIADDARRARDVATWQVRVREQWSSVRIASVSADSPSSLPVGSTFQVRAAVQLGNLSPSDVVVELYEGPLDQQDVIGAPTLTAMDWDGSRDSDLYHFTGTVVCESSGQHGYTVRVVPHHADRADRFVEGLLRWADTTG
ncbi:MAG: alpha-glucan family phosphorylase [Chloroflexota bacterium]